MKCHWIQVTPSGFPWERDALTLLKERLPDHEPHERLLMENPPPADKGRMLSHGLCRNA